MYTNTPVAALPPQYITSREKTPEWARKCVQAIGGMASSTNDMGRSSAENKQENYELVNSIFNKSNMEHVLNPFGIDAAKYGGTATKMQNYNIIRSRLETLRGEEMNSPLNYFVYAIGGEAVSAKKQKKKDHLRELMKANIVAEYQLEQQISELEGQMEELQKAINTVQDQIKLQQLQQQYQQVVQQRNSLPDIEAEMKKFNSTYVDPTEQTNNKILKFLKREDKLAMKFNQGWFHALVSSEEVYNIDIIGKHPSARPVNPLQFAYDKGANTTFIHHGNWAREEFWLPASEVIDMCGDALTTTQVKKILSGQAGHSFTEQGLQKGFVYSFDGGQRRNLSGSTGTHVYVMKCAWRSAVKVGILTFDDPRTGKQQKVEVDDTFKMTPELELANARVDWEWETEIWEGTQIGDDIFVNVRPKANQTKNLPYVGYVYNNVNSVATSMVDLVKAHQYTYIIVWWRLEQEIAKAKGKKFIMDFAQLPKSMGWSVEQWMYYFENMGVIWINSKEEGRKGDPNSTATFNQFQSIDMSLSQVVPQYMQILTKIEAMVEDVMGVSPQRMGDIGASETATGAQTSISRSTNVTKPWFYFHDLVKEEVLTELLEVAKIAYMDGEELQIFDEFEVESIKIDGALLNGSDMGVFLSNSFEDRVKKEKMMGLLEAAVNQGKASLLDIANALDSDSMSYTKSKLEEGEIRANKLAQEENNARLAAEKESNEAAERSKELDRVQEMVIARESNEKDITIKKLDIIAQAQKENPELDTLKLVKESLEFETKMAMEEKKEDAKNAQKDRELNIKEKQNENRKQNQSS